ncbi:MAG: hypothetical protein KatS3mg068_2492 [Candidatus Sericytochromatia bacterium]|nr:MAG: hypothetical protein KatS3mg068_2492 [Candidatus Sericytochromatia bacterium]
MISKNRDLNTFYEKHNQAMNLFEEYLLLKRKGNDDKNLLKKAYELEKEVALSFKNSYDKEPTRAILFKSAASIAFNADELIEEAEKMCDYALDGKPFIEIKKEVENLKKEIQDKKKEIIKNNKQTLVTVLKFDNNSNEIELNILSKVLKSIGNLLDSIKVKNKSSTKLILNPYSFKSGSFSIEYKINEFTFFPNDDISLMMNLLDTKDNKEKIAQMFKTKQINNYIIDTYINMLKVFDESKIQFSVSYFVNENNYLKSELDKNTIKRIIDLLNIYNFEENIIEVHEGFFKTITEMSKKKFDFEINKTKKIISCKISKELSKLGKERELVLGKILYKATFEVNKKRNQFKGLIEEYTLKDFQKVNK